MLGLPRTTEVRSISKVGLSVVTVTFEDDVDLYFARAQVQQRMQDAAMQLPDGAEPMLGPPATAMGEVFQYLVEPTTGARDTLTLHGADECAGVHHRADAAHGPGRCRRERVGRHGAAVRGAGRSQPKLAGYDLTLHDLATALANNNANFGAGYVEDRGERLTLRGLGRVTDATDIANVVVTTRDATPVYVREVARVTVGAAAALRRGHRDGQGEALSAAVLMLKGRTAARSSSACPSGSRRSCCRRVCGCDRSTARATSSSARRTRFSAT